MDKTCATCNKIYYVKPSRFSESSYCSEKCWRIGNKNLANTVEDKERRSAYMKKHIKENGHPKHFKGHHHTDETKEVLRQQTIKRWQTPSDHFNSEEYRQYLSDSFSKLKHPGRFSRSHGGKRDDLGGQYFRSAWEANIARYLNFLMDKGQIFKWQYEPDTFYFEEIKRGTRSYTPDFKVWEAGKDPYYIELKGWMDDRSAVKLKRMKKYNPTIRVDLIDQNIYRSIKKNLGRLISGWEFPGTKKR